METVKSLNHVGIAVKSIDEQRPFYEEVLGAKFECYEDVPSQKVQGRLLPRRRRSLGASRTYRPRRTYW